MYSIELPNRKELLEEIAAFKEIHRKASPNARTSFTRPVFEIQIILTKQLTQLKNLINQLEQIEQSIPITIDKREQKQKLAEALKNNVELLRKLKQILQNISDISPKLSQVINSFSSLQSRNYVDTDLNSYSDEDIELLQKVKTRFQSFKKAIDEDMIELYEFTDKFKDFTEQEVQLIILGNDAQQKITETQRKAYSPKFIDFIRTVTGVISAVALWFAATQAFPPGEAASTTPTPSPTASASPYASPSTSPYASPNTAERKVDFSRMPASQFAEISTLPTGQVITQNKNGQMITMNNIDKNKWVGSDGNEYISFKYPFGTKNFFNPVRKPSTAGAKPTASPAASASPSESPSSSPSPSASESPEIPFDYSKEPAGTLKSYGKTGDGMTTAIGADGDGAYLREVREFGPGVFRSIGGKLYNKKISQGTIIFVPR